MNNYNITPLALAAMFDRQLAGSVFSAVGDLGINPNPITDPLAANTKNTFGEDPWWCSELIAEQSKKTRADAESAESLLTQAIAASCVLLKNRVLPLEGRFYKKLLFTGFRSATLANAFTKILPKSEIAHVGDGYSPAEAAARAADADAVILCIRAADADMPKIFSSETRPLITVVFGAGACDMLEIDRYSDAVLWVWSSTVFHDAAVTGILTGQINPSGRLPVTFPTYESAREGEKPLLPIDVDGYTYLYRRREPMYPFGYGLSYTRFQYSCLRVDGSPDTELSVSCKLDNQWRYGGHEAVQLYLRYDCHNCPGVPRWRLVTLTRVFLRPGETREVCFTLSPENFPDSGRYVIYLGGHQPDARSVLLTETPVLSAFVTKA